MANVPRTCFQYIFGIPTLDDGVMPEIVRLLPSLTTRQADAPCVASLHHIHRTPGGGYKLSALLSRTVFQHRPRRRPKHLSDVTVIVSSRAVAVALEEICYLPTCSVCEVECSVLSSLDSDAYFNMAAPGRRRNRPRACILIRVRNYASSKNSRAGARLRLSTPRVMKGRTRCDK